MSQTTTGTRRAGDTLWRLARHLGALVLILAASAADGLAQSMDSGGTPSTGGVEEGSRGSTLEPLDGGEPGEPEKFGGMEGGAGRSAGTAGGFRSDLTRGSPGDPNESLLPPPIGASGANLGDASPGDQAPGVLGGRIGRAAVPDVRPGGSSAGRPRDPTENRLVRDRSDVRPPEFDERTLARHPRLDIPAQPDDPGPEDGLTLDAAVDRLLKGNLNVAALRYEIPKADADVLTAGLRSNPILYADAQGVPYGKYTQERPGGGGLPQYDVNVSVPIDVSRKRLARLDVATKARKVTEAQLQDELRRLVDQLYAAYVNALAARETVRYSEAYRAGVAAILAAAEARRDAAEGEDREALDEAVAELKSRRSQADFQLKQSERASTRTHRTLAQLLFLSGEEARGLKLRGRLREVAPVPEDAWLVRTALENRPDLAAYRLGLQRAQADVRLARANRYSDVYAVYQPYTFQNGSYEGVKSATSYGFGVNVALPLFNRNQGNIKRAEWNVAQTQTEAQALEYQVTREVEDQAQDLRDTIDAVRELERNGLPAARKARDAAFRSFQADPSKAGDFLGEQQDFDDVVQQYRNALIELRQDMLDLNTSTGVRVFP
ncbi:TolC family protein [Paludisphaera soli]|uniref:TolC family protein n=1 Tax=Paludisphaera soli TaxID=2712865 RepID=UPI0013ED76AB|nr:TolC family protein [Paludisphaera soli]